MGVSNHDKANLTSVEGDIEKLDIEKAKKTGLSSPLIAIPAALMVLQKISEKESDEEFKGEVKIALDKFSEKLKGLKSQALPTNDQALVKVIEAAQKAVLSSLRKMGVQAPDLDSMVSELGKLKELSDTVKLSTPSQSRSHTASLDRKDSDSKNEAQSTLDQMKMELKKIVEMYVEPLRDFGDKSSFLEDKNRKERRRIATVKSGVLKGVLENLSDSKIKEMDEGKLKEAFNDVKEALETFTTLVAVHKGVALADQGKEVIPESKGGAAIVIHNTFVSTGKLMLQTIEENLESTKRPKI